MKITYNQKAFKRLLLILVISFKVLISTSQDTLSIDSLIIQYKISQSDTNVKERLNNIASLLNQFQSEFAYKCWSDLIAFSEKNKSEYCVGYCYYYRGRKYISDGEYYKGKEDYMRCREVFKLINNKKGMADSYNALGILNDNLDNYSESFENYFEGAKLFSELKDIEAEGKIYLNMGGMLIHLINDKSSKSDTLKMTINYLQKSISILDSLNSFKLLHAYINLGEVYYKVKSYDSALYYLEKSYQVSKNGGFTVDRFQAVFHYSEFILSQFGVERAEPFINEAIQIAGTNGTFNNLPIDDKQNFSLLLSDFYAKQKNYLTAYKYLSESDKYQAESKKEQSKLDISKIEFEKSQRKNEVERTKRMWTTIIAIVTFLASILIMFAFYRSYKHKKEANRLLTEMDELKNKLYSNITHELRTPLTLILGPLEQMLSSDTEKAPSHKQVKMMRKNANSLLSLVNQMLDLTKIDAKNMKLELVEEDINKFLRTRFVAFASLAEQKSINYQLGLLNEKNVRIFDSSKLEKIINNLVSNAVKFTGNNGKISCFVKFPHPDTLELIVEDDGKGIPQDELHRIFDRFHQVKPTGEMINLGTGIGLSLTKELVELMHGKITVESEVGRGSKFMVTIPLGKAHLNDGEYQMIQILNSKNHENSEIKEPLESSEDSETFNDSNNGKESFPHVLIVEDHADIREFVAENLKNSFFVEQAENGKKGLDSAIKNIPDLVITDIVMPEMDGIELCSNLKTDERTSHIPVVMLTGKSGIHDRLKGLETGADAYLTKPFNLKELRLQVVKLIEQRQKLRERFTRDLRFEPKDIAVTSADEKFIIRAMEIIEKNIGNSDFEVRQFEEEMFMSRMQLFRKIKALTNQTPGDFIRTIRLKRAASLIKQNFGNIAQITYEVGFNNPSYFAKCFKDLYGELPSDYMKNHHS
jgi:signal transduction histidine kinase/DNA-binding response OmpR family regulator